MKLMLAGALVSCMVATSALADADTAMREVEVSLWEVVAATMFHAAAPGVKGSILGGNTENTTPSDEFDRQVGEIEQHWTEWKASASADQAESVAKFEGLYTTFLDQARAIMSSDSATPEQLLAMWQAAHAADDVLDAELQ